MAAAVVAALGEIILEGWDAQAEPWQVEVPESVPELARRAGASENEVRSALRLLADTSLVASVASAGQRRLRLSEEVFEESPPLARMDGGAVRRRLERVGASVAPALGVLRELAVASGGYADPARPGPWLEASLAHVAEATLFKRTAVSRALSELEAAALIERAGRSGRHNRYRLLPQVFGVEGPEASPSSSELASSSLPAPPAGAVRTDRAPAAESGVILEVGGVRLRLAPGICCSVALDDNGIPVVRTEAS